MSEKTINNFCNICGIKLKRNNRKNICTKCQYKHTYCVDCGKKIYRTSIRCKSCATKKQHETWDITGKNNPNYKNGKIKKLFSKKCIVCGNNFLCTYEHKKRKICSNLCHQLYRIECSRVNRNAKYVSLSCDWCGKIFEKLYCYIKNNRYNFCSKECKHFWMSENTSGEKSVRWTGGYNTYNNYGLNWHKQKKLCLNRDENICQNCGITSEEHGMNMDVHHIISFRLFNYIPKENDNYIKANDIDNLVCLCRKCHVNIENEFKEVEQHTNGDLKL